MPILEITAVIIGHLKVFMCSLSIIVVYLVITLTKITEEVKNLGGVIIE